MAADWRSVHTEALNVIDMDMGIKYFRKSKVPGAHNVYTTEESNM